MDAEANARIIAAVDEALAPAKRIAEGLGPVGHHELSAVVTSVRQALVAAVNGDPGVPEPVVEAEPEATAETDLQPEAPVESTAEAEEPAHEAEPESDPATSNIFDP